MNKRKIQSPKQPATNYDLPSHLRGLPQNRWGGHRRSNLGGFRGSTYGAASEVRKLSETEQETVITRLRKEGRIS